MLAKEHKHLPEPCKAVVIDLLVLTSSVETHFKQSACAFCSLLRQCRLLAGDTGTEETLLQFCSSPVCAQAQVVGAW